MKVLTNEIATVIAEVDKSFLNGRWANQCIFYQVEVSTTDKHNVYYVTSNGEFKTYFNNHIKSIKHSKYTTDTELSIYPRKVHEDHTGCQI